MAIAQPGGWNFTTTWAPPSPGFYPELYALTPVVRVDVDDASRQYGLANPALTSTDYGGPASYVFGPAGDSLPIILTTPADQTSPIGTYTITTSGSTATSLANIVYRLIPFDGAMTVTPAPLIVTADDQSKVYGDPFSFPVPGFTTTGLLNADTVTSATLTSPGALPTAPVAGSPYVIDISAATGTGLGNYIISYVPGAMTVTPAPLTVTADDQSKLYGDPFTFLGTEFTVTGLRNSDTVTSATLQSNATQRTALPGSYVIDIGGAQGRGLANYQIAYESGQFLVLGASPEIVPAAPPSQLVPSGTELPALLQPLAIGLRFRDPTDQISLSGLGGEAPEGAGGGPTLRAGIAGGAEAVTVESAGRTLAYLTQVSDGLEEQVRNCELARAEVDTYLACINDGLAAFAQAVDDRILDLPEPLRAVSAIIETATRSIAQTRATAAQRLQTATSAEEIETIEREAAAAARAAVRTAAGEIRKQIELIRADDADIAQLQTRQGQVIAAALDDVDVSLARATEL